MFIAVVWGWKSWAPPPPPTLPVLVAATDLSPGTVLTASDLRVVDYPRDLVPPGAHSQPSQVTGQSVMAAVPEGSVVTQAHLSSSIWGLTDDEVAIPVRISDPGVSQLLTAGMHLTLVRATGDGASVLTTRARLLVQVTAAASDGFFGGEATPSLLLLAAPRESTNLILDASAAGVLTVALDPLTVREGD